MDGTVRRNGRGGSKKERRMEVEGRMDAEARKMCWVETS